MLCPICCLPMQLYSSFGAVYYRCLNCNRRIMEFDKSKVYTAVNADELEVGDVVIVADSLYDIKQFMQEGEHICEIASIESSDCTYRFTARDTKYALAYLIAKRDDPYKEFAKAQAEGKDIWYRNNDGEWNLGKNYSFSYPVERYSLTDPTSREYKVYLYQGCFVFTYVEVPEGAHVYYSTTDAKLASDWCTKHNKFAEVAKAWEEGATIEFRSDGNNWIECTAQPKWLADTEYRVRPVPLKWTDLKIGDVIRSKDGNSTALVTQIDIEDRTGYERHISIGFEWLDDTRLAEWEKVEKK